MDQFFKSLSKASLAFLAIGGGILFIIISDPPHTLCDSQLESFKKDQQKFLYVNPKNESEETSRHQRLQVSCKISNSPGGCYEYFIGLKKMLRDARAVPNECMEDLGDLSAFRKAVYDSVGLMANMAWGEKPPETYYEKFGWLNTADISLFCHLKQHIENIYGQEAWRQYQEQVMKAHPGAKDLQRKDLWEKTLFSVNCSEYP